MPDTQPSAQTGALPFFETRGVVIVPKDLTWKDWPARAKAAGLTTLALHPTPRVVEDFIASEAGQAFLEACRVRSSTRSPACSV